MCSLNNAINLYREEAEKEDIKEYVIVKATGEEGTKEYNESPIHNKKGNIEYYKSKKKANDNRMYYQPDYDELLKVVQISRDC